MTMFVTITYALATLFCHFTGCYSHIVNGVHAGINGTGARPFRQNINVLKNSGPVWDLYILSLQRFMDLDQDDELSYYKICGIHGYPANRPWDGVTGSAGGIGFCEHGSVLFPIWHRPYLALFEERLWEFAQSIAREYPLSQRITYEKAAVSLRIPYWDWSLNSTIPDVVSNHKITINTPIGMKKISNPLYSYRFHPLIPADLPYLSQYPATVREPNTQTLKSQDNLVNQGLEETAQYWHDSAYQLFSISDWVLFSASLELLHGGIHNYVGGPSSPNTGHMTYIWYSAFDPIFWLHHAQIDRLVALWQAIHPYSYIEPQESTISTYYTPAGTILTEDSPLAPFHRDVQGEFHNGHTARRLKTYGYSYPELVYWSKVGSNVWTLQKEVISIVNTLYQPGVNNGDLRGTSNGESGVPRIRPSLAMSEGGPSWLEDK